MSVETGSLGFTDYTGEFQVAVEPFPGTGEFRAIGAVAFDEIGAIQDPADPFDDLELGLVMAEALATLPCEQREILRLRYVEGLTVSSAASRLGIPEGTASTRAWHALRKLRTYFTPPGESRPII